jgi:DNA polymerase III subunit chi
VTRVDFYVIDSPSERQHERLVCRLAERAWRAGHSVHIRCADAERASSVDDLLWSYQDTTFLPHAQQHTEAAEKVPVIIGYGDQTPGTADVLINLGHDVADYFSRFERVLETTGADTTARAAARERYRYYQERGYTLNTHNLDSPHGR